MQHTVLTPLSFRIEYKRAASGMLQRQVRMQVDINHVSTAVDGPEALYAITFTLLSGKSLKERLSLKNG